MRRTRKELTEIGMIIEEHMHTTGQTLTQICDATGIHPATLRKLRFDQDHVGYNHPWLALAKLFGCTLESLRKRCLVDKTTDLIAATPSKRLPSAGGAR